MRYRKVTLGHWRFSYRVAVRSGFRSGWMRNDVGWSLSLPFLFVSAVKTLYR